MKISVIVPIYNCEDFLSACLDSILSQTYSDLQVILVDDGSTDKSAEICDQYAMQDARVCVFHQENKGVSSARNLGLHAAIGELVSFVDSDDTLEPDMFELLVRTMQHHHADISHCGFNRVENGVIRPIYDSKQTMLQTSEEAIRCLLTGKFFTGSLWNKLFKKSILEGLFFCEELRINEDILFGFEAFKRAKQIVFSDFAKYNYMIRGGNSACFITPDEKKLKDSMRVNRYMYEELLESNLESVAAGRYLRSLSGFFRNSMSNRKKESKSIAETIWSVARKTTTLEKNMKLTAYLIHYCPKIYCLIFSVYDRIRKPKWEV